MTTEVDVANEIAKEIAKQIPTKQLYEEGLSPAVRQAGYAFEDIVKCIRLVGFPIQWLAIQQDRFRSFIERAKNQVSEEKRVLPAPQILGPILEGIKFEIDNTLISEMFENLLRSAMNKDKLYIVHPSFSGIIKSLSPDEALILKHLTIGPIFALERRPGIGDPITNGIFIYQVDEIGLMYPQNAYFYTHHLFAHGLLDWDQKIGTAGVVYEGQATNRTALKLSILGQRFIVACMRDS